MPLVDHNGLTAWMFDVFAPHPSVTGFVTTRTGGGSRDEFASLNLGLSTGDDPEMVVSNRRRVVEATGVPLDRLTVGSQVHEARIAVVTDDLAGSGHAPGNNPIPSTDGLVTALTGTPLMALVADCVAVLLYDPVRRVAGVAHAGWRGTVANIVAEAVATMTANFATNPSDVIAGIGPSIGPCCYEVGSEVVDAFYAQHPGIGSEVLAVPEFASAGSFERGVNTDAQHLDLWRANQLQLIDAGLHEDNIEVAMTCTSCNTESYYSHRAEHGKTGRFAAIVLLNAHGDGAGD